MQLSALSLAGSWQVLAEAETPVPLVWAPVVSILAGTAVLLCGLLVFLYSSRAGIIARATLKEALRQPVFSLLLALGLVLLVANTFVPFFSFGDDVKMLKDCGLAAILLLGLVLAVWTSSTSIADEIEGKTAMTLLSKPINRRQFIVGKYIGILSAVGLLLLPLAVVFVGLVDYKVFYDARESSRELEVNHTIALAEAVQVAPGIVLSFLEIAILSAISVAISTRLPMVVNIATCLTIWVVGHLTPAMVHTSVEGLELLLFMARIIATVLPALDVFNIGASIATGSIVPPVYLLWSTVYAAVYSTVAILLAFILFEDRDLA